MADEDDELSHYGYGRARGRSSMYLVPVYGGEGSDDDTEESSTSPGSFAMGMPRNTLLISLPVRQRSRSSTSSGGTYSMMGSLMQMLFGSSAMDESSDETKPLPLPPAKGEKKDQPESSKDQSHKPRNSDEEMDRLRKIIEQGVQKQKIKEKSEEERTGEISDATGQDIDHDPSETQSNLQETDEVKVDDQHLTELETTLNEHGMESDSMKADSDENDDEDDRKETTGHAVSIETNIQRNKILPLSQQLKKDADKSMNFLKSLWSVQKDNPNSVANNSNIDKPVTESDEIYTETSQVQSNNSEYHHTDNIQQEKLEVDDIRSCAVDNISPGLSEDGVISPGEKLHRDSQNVEHLPYESSRSISFAEQDLSDGESLEEDCDYSNDLGGAVPEHDLEQEISSVKGQAKDQSPPIEVPLKNDEKLFKSKFKDDFDKAQESADDAVKALEKGVNEQKTKGDNPSSTEPGDLKSGDSKKPVTSNEGNRNIKSSQSSPDYYDDDLGDDYDEKYGYSPMNSKYAKLAKSPLATQLSRLTGVMSGMQSLAEQHGFEIKDVIPDGNCMFSALVDQLRICGNFDYNTQSLRKAAVSYLRDNPYHEDGTHLQSFLYRETWDEYLQRMEKETVWGDHMVLQACTEVLECKIYVYKPSTNETVLAPNSTEADDSSDLYLGHVGESHFVSLRRTDWEKMWHLKAQIHRNRRRNRKLVLKYLKTTAEMNTLKKKSQALEKTIENLSLRSLPSEISTDQQEEMSKDMIEHDEIASVSSGACRQSSLTSEHDDNEDMISPAEEVPVDEEEPPDTEISGACSAYSIEDENLMVDLKSELSIPHLSYILKYLIRPKDIFEMPADRLNCKFDDGNTLCKFIGSVIEGFRVTLISSKNMNAINNILQIPIIIGISPVLTVGHARQPESILDCQWNMDRTHPGYLHLSPLCPELLPRCVCYWIDSKTPILQYSERRKITGNVDVSGRMFTGYKCQGWPEVASRTFMRMQQSPWPGKKIIDSILRTECFVIDKAHPKSEYQMAEWQFIFADAEQLLATEALSVDQKHVFKVFKILVDFHLRLLPRQLKTTHLKSVLYRAVADIPDNSWSENLGNCLIVLLEKLSKDIKSRNIPNFFIPENNMVDHFSTEEFKVLDEKLTCIRQFPLMALTHLADHYSLVNTWIIDNVVGDIDIFLANGNLLKTIKEVFVPTTVEIARHCMEKKQYSEASKYLRMAYQELKKGYASESGKPRNMVETFQEFAVNILKDEKLETQQKLSYRVDEDYGTTLTCELNEGKTTYTLKDLIGDKAGAFSNMQIADKVMDSTEKQVQYLDDLAYDLFLQSRLDEAKTLLHCGISIGKKARSTKIINTEHILDLALKQDIESQVQTRNMKVDILLLECYIHLHLCNTSLGVPEMCVEYVDDFENICEQLSLPMYYAVVVEMWRCLGHQEKTNECEKKLIAMKQKPVGSMNSVLSGFTRAVFGVKYI